MFKLQVLLEENMEDLAELCTRENGKHVDESKGEILRGIEVVELAASITTLMKGETLDQVSQGVDCNLYKEPLGVVTAITPFNFPVMIPLWFAPLAGCHGQHLYPQALPAYTPLGRAPCGALLRGRLRRRGLQRGTRGHRDGGGSHRPPGDQGHLVCWLLRGGSQHLQAGGRAG